LNLIFRDTDLAAKAGKFHHTALLAIALDSNAPAILENQRMLGEKKIGTAETKEKGEESNELAFGRFHNLPLNISLAPASGQRSFFEAQIIDRLRPFAAVALPEVAQDSSLSLFFAAFLPASFTVTGIHGRFLTSAPFL
jgi:hypothetical protein